MKNMTSNGCEQSVNTHSVLNSGLFLDNDLKKSGRFKIFNRTYMIRSNNQEFADVLCRRFGFYISTEVEVLDDTLINIRFIEDTFDIDFKVDYNEKKINGLPVDSVVKKDLFVISRSGEKYTLWRMCDLLIRYVHEKYDLIEIYISKMSNERAAVIGKEKYGSTCNRGNEFNFEEVTDFIIAIISLINNGFSLHAASLEYDGKAVILTAPSGTGKTTTSLAMSYGGFKLMSDEITIVRNDSGISVAGLMIPPRIFGGEVHDTDSLIRNLKEKSSARTKSNLILSDKCQIIADKFIKPRCIIFLTRENDQKTDHTFTELNARDAIVRLNSQILDPCNGMRIEKQFEIIFDLVKSCRLIELSLGTDIASLSDYILNIVNEI